MNFKLKAPFSPTGDQPTAIKQLVNGVEEGRKNQVLLGVTGSGKTYSVACLIEKTQLPTLVIAHNKTLAAQLYQEFRDFFPQNAVSYFVSYYDYYQPEAYIPSSDTYIEKEATINDEIDKLRLSATTNLLTRKDVIVVASVSCIYNLGSPVEYGKNTFELMEGELIKRETLLLQLANLQYERSDLELRRGSYRIRGDVIQLWPAYEDVALKIETLENKIVSIHWIDPVTGSPKVSPHSHTIEPTLAMTQEPAQRAKKFTIYPAKHYTINDEAQQAGLTQIEADLKARVEELKTEGKIVEAYRLNQKVSHDVMMMRELGYVNGIENYSRYFDGRLPGEAPYTLIDYFHENARLFSQNRFLTIVDESHMTLPQIRGMHAGDQARKTNLIEYGFRLPSAFDNRPLKFSEFMNRMEQIVYVSATPNNYEVSLSEGKVVEQLIRPTGLVDPQVTLRSTKFQIEDLVMEVIARKKLGQRTLVTTLTKRMSEALTEYLNDHEKILDLIERRKKHLAELEQIDPDDRILLDDGLLPIDKMEIGKLDEAFLKGSQHQTAMPNPDSVQFPKVAYLHSDVTTLDRSDILDDLRRGTYDVIVGINLLREGLDLPEVSLVAILDADKEGFLRSRSALIQTMGRAARHEGGQVILYADYLTGSMKAAIGETQRRRKIQLEFNQKNNITAVGISKPFRERMIEKTDETDEMLLKGLKKQKPEEGLFINLSKMESIDLTKIKPADLTPVDRKKLAAKLRRRMNQAAKELDYELAAILRDHVYRLSN
ncbi:MAG: excinuclease ABC subunit B [Candidatus Pacebacteria bacterium CG_4_10_14_0_8_um_filter_43_12]|nr:MAG: excinuclease ABC subunit B [Candidatus Pacebacteria bacterium CG10_big_fil_rev_8_21_14_0_10_44_11]PIY79817.1 MAG: excinuclease ABC subunit B [Candidatus Pacebacteria bacterium CG_4_10_14_0_8_um_filter_43_12]